MFVAYAGLYRSTSCDVGVVLGFMIIIIIIFFIIFIIIIFIIIKGSLKACHNP